MRTISVFTALLLGTWLSAAPASVSAAPKAAAKSVTAKKGAKKSKARHAVFSGYQVPEARLRGNPLPLNIAITLIGLFVIVRHRTNITRLLNGTENKFTKKQPPVQS